MGRYDLRLIPLVVLAMILGVYSGAAAQQSGERPNILVAISDDQSYPHMSAYGYQAVETPAFDRVAREGVLFTNAITPSPGCSPMRAAFLTGRHVWQIENAGTHASSFPKKYTVYPSALAEVGYWTGHTGKGWGPGNWKISGWEHNPAGPEFSQIKMDAPRGIHDIDYAANFKAFLDQRPEGKPFCFWYGGHEPHRRYKEGIGEAHGIDPAQVKVPAFLPDTPEVRGDIADYLYEIQWFDRHLGRMLKILEEAGELENTLVIVTSDNGMPFPRAKANAYEYGIHMPLAVRWGDHINGGRIVHDPVNLIDLTATIYEATGVRPPQEHPLTGKSLMGILRSEKQGYMDPERDATYSARERHSSSRYLSLGYPQRAIRTRRYLYIRNFRPERWPAGAPRKFGTGSYASRKEMENRVLGPPHGGYHDIDPAPTLDVLIENREDPLIGRYFHMAVDKRPAEQLYDIQRDPACLSNLADDPLYDGVQRRLSDRLMNYLKKTGDPRVVGPDKGDIFETYPRYSGLRMFPTPDWAEENPDRVPPQDWVKERIGEYLEPPEGGTEGGS